MLIGDHPLGWGRACSVDNPDCPWRWVFECWAPVERPKAPRKKPRHEHCGRRSAIACSGSSHILLSEATAALAQQGWTLAPDGGGWRCPDHRTP